MDPRIRPFVLVTAACAILSSCSDHRSQAEPSPINNLTYIDVQPGWRIRVVAPILKSGGYNVQLEAVKNQNGTTTMKTGKDFKGYETDYYKVRPTGDLLKISFRSAQVRSNDRSSRHASTPIVSLFNLPLDTRCVRLLFLTRSSDRDHDQAILSASSAADLEALTSQVQANPTQNCKSQSEASCVWVPAGVAVRPEKKRGREWVPAL